jgi:hypothetical protein
MYFTRFRTDYEISTAANVPSCNSRVPVGEPHDILRNDRLPLSAAEFGSPFPFEPISFGLAIGCLHDSID